jgi:hypothetical protein
LVSSDPPSQNEEKQIHWIGTQRPVLVRSVGQIVQNALNCREMIIGTAEEASDELSLHVLK